MKSFQRTQIELARHLRSPDECPAPQGIEDRRAGIYRDLIYNNIAGFIAGAFPIIKQILPEEFWHTMVRDFIAHHESKTPYFLEISQEFLQYLIDTSTDKEIDKSTNESSDKQYLQKFPFLIELAHYEWVELALDVAPDELPDIYGAGLSLMDARPRVSPLAWSLVYQFPVHKIGAAYCPQVAPDSPSFLLAYRTRSDTVKFMEINAITYGLLQLLQADPMLTARQALTRIGHEINHPQLPQLLCEGELLLRELMEAEVIVGVDQ
jgi:hypothetical protein